VKTHRLGYNQPRTYFDPKTQDYVWGSELRSYNKLQEFSDYRKIGKDIWADAITKKWRSPVEVYMNRDGSFPRGFSKADIKKIELLQVKFDNLQLYIIDCKSKGLDLYSYEVRCKGESLILDLLGNL
jgi:Fe-S cluster assembly ATPase SufC